MLKKIIKRFIIFLRFIQEVENWNLVFLIYFGFFKKDRCTLNLRNKLYVKLRTSSTDIQAFANVWIIEEYNKSGFEITDNDVVIDIGAHIGLFTLYATQHCKTGRIFCFEPVKDNFDLLVENIRINNLLNVNYFNKAVHSHNEPVRVYLDDIDQAAHSIFGHGKKFVDVDTVTLPQIFDSNEIKLCNLLKLDCEGSEYEILRATSDEYFKKIQKICLEYHILKNDHKSLHLLKNRLSSLGFQVIDIPSTDNLGMLYAKKD